MKLMSANVRRLFLDIGPWVWAYIAFQLCVAALLDSFWLRRHGAPLPLPLLWLPGVLLNLSASHAGRKVPFWRTLPVSRTEIDQARWWQGVAGPTLLLCAIATSTALVMDALGLRRAAWPDIVTLGLAQSAIGVLLMGIVAIVFPFAAQTLGRWSALLIFPLFLAFVRVASIPLSEQTDFRALLVAGLAIGAVLYILAGHWPAPLTTALWDVPAKDRAPSASGAAKAPGLRGWPILVWANFPTFALVWALTVCIPPAVKWLSPKHTLGTAGWITCVVALQISVSGIAIAMRTLRALPLSGRQLTCRLVLLVLSVQAISLLVLEVALLMSGEREFSPAIFLLPLAYSLVYLPVVLRFGLRVSQFGVALSFIVIIPIQILAPYVGAVWWIVIGSLAVMAAGSAWSYWEIARGYRAYRIQPLVPARWRGF